VPYTSAEYYNGNLFIEARDSISGDPVPHVAFVLKRPADSLASFDPPRSRAQFLKLVVGTWRLQVLGTGYSPVDTIVEIRPQCRTNVRVAFLAASCSGTPGCVSAPSRVTIETCGSNE
jgi:hypothetical protein